MATVERALPLEVVAPQPRLREHETLRRLGRIPTGLLGAALLAVVILAAIAAPALAPYGYDDQNLANRLKPPAWTAGGTWSHVLGTDPLGRDILSRVIYSARTSLSIAAISVL